MFRFFFVLILMLSVVHADGLSAIKQKLMKIKHKAEKQKEKEEEKAAEERNQQWLSNLKKEQEALEFKLEAQYKNALKLFQQHKYAEAEELASGLVQAKYIKAYPLYADLHIMGRGGITREPEKGSELILKIDSEGLEDLLDQFGKTAFRYLLGRCLYKGYGMAENKKSAEYWVDLSAKAAKAHRSTSWLKGNFYFYNFPDRALDYKKAKKFYEQGVDEEECEFAAEKLGYIYSTKGRGTLVSYPTALKYYQKSYKWGLPDAGCHVASLLLGELVHLQSKYGYTMEDFKVMIRDGYENSVWSRDYCQQVWSKYGMEKY
jgi:TPR repeat protein